MSRLRLVRADELPLGGRLLYLGVKGRDVEELQSILRGLRLLQSGPTGEYDYLTVDAVKTLQKRFNLYPDGKAGAKTLKILKGPGLKEQIYLNLEGENLKEVGVGHQVGLSAFKDPENRRCLSNPQRHGLVMVENREVWALKREVGVENPAVLGFSGLLIEEEEGREEVGLDIKAKVSKKGINFFSLATPGKKTENSEYSGEKQETGECGLVCDLRRIKQISKRVRKRLKYIKQQEETAVFWWLTTLGRNYANLPSVHEGDGVIYSPPLLMEETFTHQTWYNQVKKLTRVYPCTRLLLHFDLQGREREEKGGFRLLSPREAKAVRLSGWARTTEKRLGEDGWVFIRDPQEEKDRIIFLADLRTLRGIISRVDRLNLAGLVLTGTDFLVGNYQRELNRCFQVFPRRWVINKYSPA